MRSLQGLVSRASCREQPPVFQNEAGGRRCRFCFTYRMHLAEGTPALASEIGRYEFYGPRLAASSVGIPTCAFLALCWGAPVPLGGTSRP
eukprot:8243348-Pyramimonas_sp.AAC.1